MAGSREGAVGFGHKRFEVTDETQTEKKLGNYHPRWHSFGLGSQSSIFTERRGLWKSAGTAGVREAEKRVPQGRGVRGGSYSSSDMETGHVRHTPEPSRLHAKKIYH